MHLKYAAFTYEQILPFVLALLLIFILPMMMRRYGWDWGDLLQRLTGGIWKKEHSAVTEEKRIRSGEKKKEPHLSNGGKHEMMEALSQLITFSRRQKVGIVFPGTINVDGELTTLLCFLVMKSEVIGISCYGFAGTITAGKGDGPWNQHMNGADIQILNPVARDKSQQRLVRKAMDQHDMKNVPMRVVGVFTNRNAVLAVGEGTPVRTLHDFIAEMKVQAAEENERLDPNATARQLSALITRVKKQQTAGTKNR